MCLNNSWSPYTLSAIFELNFNLASYLHVQYIFWDHLLKNMYQGLLDIRDWRILWIYFSPLSQFYSDVENMILQGHSIF